MTWNEFWGICTHKWKEDSREHVYWTEADKDAGQYMCVFVRLQCEKCGNFKTVKI